MSLSISDINKMIECLTDLKLEIEKTKEHLQGINIGIHYISSCFNNIEAEEKQ